MADFRSQRMPSPDGLGNAKSKWRSAWDAYANAVNHVANPLVAPAIRSLVRTVSFDAMGFWVAWQLEGGFEGVQKTTGMSRSAMFRRIALFRKATGKHPDEFKIPGVHIDLEEYFKAMQALAAQKEASPDKLD